jgi:hypothetical protein
MKDEAEQSIPSRGSAMVAVYIDAGIVFEYEVSDAMKGREHAAAIVRAGYRHTPKGSNDLEWFPPHRIEKVKVIGGAESTAYRDSVRST